MLLDCRVLAPCCYRGLAKTLDWTDLDPNHNDNYDPNNSLECAKSDQKHLERTYISENTNEENSNGDPRYDGYQNRRCSLYPGPF